MAKVLVVDDTPDVVRLMARFLERAGHQVATAGDGSQGLRMARANPPDAILLDVMMPGMDGLEVLRHLKEDPELRGIPVILVTAKSGNQDVVAGLEAGAHDYVAKPFTREVLLARVEAALRVKQSHDRLAEANRRLQEEIVQRVRAQRELAEARRLQAIGHLAAGIAHELNTPAQYLADNIRFLKEALSSVEELLDRFHGLLRAAKRDGVSDALLAEVEKAMEDADVVFLSKEVSQSIEQALQGVEQVASIVRSMKEFAQPGARHKQPVDLNQILLDTLRIARNEWRDVADLVTDFAEDLPMVPCLPSDLRQALVNLLVNAAEAMAEAVKDGARGKGTLTVRTRRDGDWAEIRVEDTGVGIPPAIQDQVFDPFFTTKAPGKGFGQGLSIARSIVVERHGGKMTFETEVGRGTAFVVRLPIAETAPSARVEDRELAAAPGRSCGVRQPSRETHDEKQCCLAGR